MASNLSIDLGKVSISPEGAYSATTTYERLDAVSINNSSYLSIKDNNLNHAVTDTAWWFCLVDGTAAQTQAAAAQTQAANAQTMASRAEANAAKAAAAASTAEALTEELTSQLAEATEANAETATLQEQLRGTITQALNILNAINGIEEVNPVQGLPAAIHTDAPASVPAGSQPEIFVELTPKTANQSVVFTPGSSGTIVNPAGKVIATPSTGEISVFVTSTLNSKIWKEVKITIRAASVLQTEGGVNLTTEAEQTIEI